MSLDNRNRTWTVGLIIALLVLLLPLAIGSSGGGSGDVASTSQCPNGQFAYNTTETSGVISTLCSGKGIWPSFPTATQCPFTVQTSITVPDGCEFQFNTTSRAVLLSTNYNPQIEMIVDCRRPSNTAGAFLYLQVANYS